MTEPMTKWGLNVARKWLYSYVESRSLENVPPTQAALRQYNKQASYQAYSRNKALSWIAKSEASESDSLASHELPSGVDLEFQKGEGPMMCAWKYLMPILISTTFVIDCQLSFLKFLYTWLYLPVHWLSYWTPTPLAKHACKTCPSFYCIKRKTSWPLFFLFSSSVIIQS